MLTKFLLSLVEFERVAVGDVGHMPRPPPRKKCSIPPGANSVDLKADCRMVRAARSASPLKSAQPVDAHAGLSWHYGRAGPKVRADDSAHNAKESRGSLFSRRRGTQNRRFQPGKNENNRRATGRVERRGVFTHLEYFGVIVCAALGAVRGDQLLAVTIGLGA